MIIILFDVFNTWGLMTYHYLSVTNITLGDSKDNPMMISDKSPIKDENDWWIKTLKLRDSDRALILKGVISMII